MGKGWVMDTEWGTEWKRGGVIGRVRVCVVWQGWGGVGKRKLRGRLAGWSW